MNLNITSIFFVLFFACSGVLTAQVNDDFSDGDFTQNPTWTGTEALFVVAPYPLDESNLMLRSNSPGAANYFLSTPNSIIDDVYWEFFFNLRFATSGANYVDVYLMADNADLSAVQNGYFIRLGGTPDEISFYKVQGGSVSQLIDGEDGVIGSSSNNPFRVRMSRTADALWTLEYDQGDNGIFVSGGLVTDGDISTTTSFGFRIEQSGAASPINNHFFDDVVIAPIPVDETPPSLIQAIPGSSNTLVVTFSEPVDESSATSLANYNVNQGVGVPTNASWSPTSPTSVTLTFGTDFLDGQLHTLTVSGVQDLSGNAIGSESIDFFYFIPGEGTFKQVVFNELMIDPNPPVGLPDAEYIELYNTSTSFFDLSGWTLVNTTTARTLTAAVIPPGGYLLLCNTSDVDAFAPFGEVMGIPSFVALANTADSLTLLNPQGDIIDIVSYTISWYNDPDKDEGGYALELINPLTECSGQNNWRASDDASGGTPGAENSVFNDTPDTHAPTIVSFELVNPSLIRIRFSEPMDQASLETATYAWNSGISTNDVSAAPDLLSVLIGIDTELLPGPVYQLTIDGPADCNGNPLAPGTAIQIQVGEIPELHDLLISELMPDPTPSVGLPEAEYFELYNASDKVIDIQGITLSGLDFSSPRLLAPGEYLLCTSTTTQSEFFAYPDAYFLPMSTTFLTNGGKELVLTNQNGVQIDRVKYDISWYYDPAKDDGGYSLERINLNEPCRAGDNWTASVASSGGTPGAENSVFDETPDQTPPDIEAVFVLSELMIEVRFTEVIDSVSTVLALVTISPEIQIVSATNVAPDYTSVLLELGDPLEEGIAYEITIEGITDCTGNPIVPNDPFPLGLPQQGLEGDLLINEVLFNPRTGGVDFVEIVNVSDKIIGLQNWALQNQTFSTSTISENPQLIFPGQYLVFTTNPANIRQEYPQGREENYVKMESLPSYNNSEGTVILADKDLNIMDRFDYLESYHLQLLGDFKGVSLERISFTRPTNEPDNWTSAAQTVGFATPGYINSQYNPEDRASSGFELQNEIFSPDNDGFSDILLINYSIDIPGALANINIFDRRGRLVKLLANNVLLGTEGTITWDGVQDNGSKARIGPHIILIELFNVDGRTEAFKIPCIVAGRLSD